MTTSDPAAVPPPEDDDAEDARAIRDAMADPVRIPLDEVVERLFADALDARDPAAWRDEPPPPEWASTLARDFFAWLGVTPSDDETKALCKTLFAARDYGLWEAVWVCGDRAAEFRRANEAGGGKTKWRHHEQAAMACAGSMMTLMRPGDAKFACSAGNIPGCGEIGGAEIVANFKDAAARIGKDDPA